MIATIYIIYAIVQGILVARYMLDMKENEGPVMLALIMAALAPLVSILVAGYFIHYALNWLITYRPKR